MSKTNHQDNPWDMNEQNTTAEQSAQTAPDTHNAAESDPWASADNAKLDTDACWGTSGVDKADPTSTGTD